MLKFYDQWKNNNEKKGKNFHLIMEITVKNEVVNFLKHFRLYT